MIGFNTYDNNKESTRTVEMILGCTSGAGWAMDILRRFTSGTGALIQQTQSLVPTFQQLIIYYQSLNSKLTNRPPGPLYG